MSRNYKYGSRSKACFEGMAAPLIDVCMRAQQIANRANDDIYIPDWGYSSGFRTAEQQREMYDKGVSKCDGVIEISQHQLGNAIDFYAYIDGKASYKPEDLNPVIMCHLQAAMELNIRVWTGSLFRSFNDSPHIELMI